MDAPKNQHNVKNNPAGCLYENQSKEKWFIKQNSNESWVIEQNKNNATRPFSNIFRSRDIL